MKNKSKFPQSEQKALAHLIGSGKYAEAQTICRSLPGTKQGTWGYYGERFADWLDDQEQLPGCTIFQKGNAKLPFYAFSAFPIVTCPGMGLCEKWCYSLKSWRYPTSFFRQAYNTVLIKEQSKHLANAWLRLPVDVTVRLYVDGDIDSMSTLKFWFNLLAIRSDLRAYGYSKSFSLFTSYKGEWPNNYKLNLSSGSKHPVTDKLRDLPIVRGEFRAVHVPKHLAGKYSNPEYRQAVRDSAKSEGIERGFVCPGKCGPCTKKGHACGLNTFKDVPILIGIH
jgi:hypothetical protein